MPEKSRVGRLHTSAGGVGEKTRVYVHVGKASDSEGRSNKGAHTPRLDLSKSQQHSK